MEKIEENLKHILPDVKLLKDQLGLDISQVGIIGSILVQPFSEIGDIDIVLYCNEPLEKVKKRILHIPLRYPVCPQNINGAYGPKQFIVQGLHYHVILLNSNHPNKIFENINKGKMLFI